MRKTIIIALFTAAGIVFPIALSAQSGDQPILIVNCSQSGEYSGTGYQVTGTGILRLCTVWQGQAGGLPSTELYKLRRSVKGLKAGERLQFYLSQESGEGTDSYGYKAVTVSTGEGAAISTVTGKPSRTSPEQTWTFEDKPSGALPPSAYPTAEIVRRESGAVIRLNDIYGPNNGGEGYFYGVCVDNAELTSKQRENLFSFTVSEAELANWDSLTKSISGSARGPSGKGLWKYSITVTSRVPDLGEVAVEVENWDKWVPEGNIDDEAKAGNDITVKAWVCKAGDPKSKGDKPATITFELTEVGREKGVCANWPTTPAESAARSDLVIDEDKNPDLEQVNLDLEAKTRGPVKETRAVISSFDYAAWGILRVTAEDKDGRPMKVTYINKKDIDRITIPKDEDRNRIADAWAEEKGVTGLPADWDKAEVAGQDVKGDGLSLYQKYRGFVVSGAGGKHYLRLEPREKVHFIIDIKLIFDESRWLASTGIRAYKVQQAWTDNRRVDVNRGFGGGKGKWATRLELDETPVNEGANAKDLDNVREQWAASVGAGAKWIGTPKNVELCTVYSGRIRYNLRWLRDGMLRSLRAPASAADRAEAAWLLSLGLSREELVTRLKGMNDAELEPLVKRLVAWAAIHEVGHSCGVNGHLNSQGEESQLSVPYVPDCPSQYMLDEDKWRLVLFGRMGGQGKFCNVDPHHCWRGLTSKD